MKRMIALAAALFFVVFYVTAAEKKAEKEATIKGEVVDVSCYVAQGAKGEKHKACAQACADAGGALGILTSGGKLYVSLMPDDHSGGPNALLKEHIAEMVDAKGFVRSKGGVNGIMIKSVSAANAEAK